MSPATWAKGFVAGCILLGLAASPASSATRRLSFDDASCAYVARYDPQRYDAAVLKATLAFLADNTPPLEFGPPISTPKDVAKADIAAYQAACAARERKFLGLPLLDDPDVAELRRQKIAELRQSCDETVAKLRAAKGDVAALRGFAPATPYCDRFADGLDLPDAKFDAFAAAFFHDYCVQQHSNDPDCAKTLFKDADKPDAPRRKRLFVLEAGWHNCANAHLLHNEGFDGTHESGSDRLRKRLFDRYKTRLGITQSCEYPD